MSKHQTDTGFYLFESLISLFLLSFKCAHKIVGLMVTFPRTSILIFLANAPLFPSDLPYSLPSPLVILQGRSVEIEIQTQESWLLTLNLPLYIFSALGNFVVRVSVTHLCHQSSFQIKNCKSPKLINHQPKGKSHQE